MSNEGVSSLEDNLIPFDRTPMNELSTVLFSALEIMNGGVERFKEQLGATGASAMCIAVVEGATSQQVFDLCFPDGVPEAFFSPVIGIMAVRGANLEKVLAPFSGEHVRIIHCAQARKIVAYAFAHLKEFL